MLVQLSIRDLVLIERVSLELDPGLSVLTGETGAGKSILLDGLNLALGERADAGLVRSGAPQASVTAEFRVGEGHPALALLAEPLGADQAESWGLIWKAVDDADLQDQAMEIALKLAAGWLLRASAYRRLTRRRLLPMHCPERLCCLANNTTRKTITAGSCRFWPLCMRSARIW